MQNLIKIPFGASEFTQIYTGTEIGLAHPGIEVLR